MPLRVLAGSVALVLAGALIACGDSGTPRTVAASDELTIYTALPEHGPQAPRARDVLDGERLALLLADGRAGAFAVTLRPVSDAAEPDPEEEREPDEPEKGWEPEAALAAAEAAVADPTTIAFIGDFDAGATALTLPVTNPHDLLQVSPATTYGGFTGDPGKAPGEPEKYQPSSRPTFGRIAVSDAVQARAMADVLAEEGCTRVAVLRAPNAFDDSLARLFAKAAGHRGMEVVVDEQVRDDDPDDHAALAEEVVEAGAGCATYVAGPADAPASVLGALHAADPTLSIVLPLGLADDGVARALGPAAAVTTVVGPPPPDPALRTAFERRFGRDPGPWAAYGFDAMRRVLRAIEAAGGRGNDRRAVVEAYLALAPPPARLALWRPTADGLRLVRELTLA